MAAGGARYRPDPGPGAPTEPGALAAIARRISFIRESNFGVLFNVQSKADADSNAYTAFNLPLHSDLPTRELQPGLQFLHCLVNDAAGGESIFVDGFAIADALRREDPEAFRTLCEIPVEFRNKDRHSDYRCLAPIIALTPWARWRRSAWPTSCAAPSMQRQNRCHPCTTPIEA